MIPPSDIVTLLSCCAPRSRRRKSRRSVASRFRFTRSSFLLYLCSFISCHGAPPVHGIAIQKSTLPGYMSVISCMIFVVQLLLRASSLSVTLSTLCSGKCLSACVPIWLFSPQQYSTTNGLGSSSLTLYLPFLPHLGTLYPSIVTISCNSTADFFQAECAKRIMEYLFPVNSVDECGCDPSIKTAFLWMSISCSLVLNVPPV